MPKKPAKVPRAAVALNGRPKKVGRGMPEMPFGPLVRRTQLMQHDADDLAEGQRDDGEIVAAQAQHREAEHDAPEAPRGCRRAAGRSRSEAEIRARAARRSRRRPRRRRRSRDRAGRRGRPRCSGPSRASCRSGPGCRDRASSATRRTAAARQRHQQRPAPAIGRAARSRQRGEPRSWRACVRRARGRAKSRISETAGEHQPATSDRATAVGSEGRARRSPLVGAQADQRGRTGRARPAPRARLPERAAMRAGGQRASTAVPVAAITPSRPPAGRGCRSAGRSAR